MASRHQRRKRAKAKRLAMETSRREAFIAFQKSATVNENLAHDNRPTATVYRISKDGKKRGYVTVQDRGYSRITDSYVQMVQGGGLRESVNLNRPIGDSDRQIAALKKRLDKD